MANINERGERFSHLLASELKGAIGAYGQTVRKVSEKINVHHTTMSNYFNGSRALPSTTFNDACEVIGADPAELVDRAYRRLIREMGIYQEEDAKVIELYTPVRGIPVITEEEAERHAALQVDYDIDEEIEHHLDTP